MTVICWTNTEEPTAAEGTFFLKSGLQGATPMKTSLFGLFLALAAMPRQTPTAPPEVGHSTMNLIGT